MKKLLSFFAILCICTTAAVAQCPDDFTDLHSPYVTGYTGYQYQGGYKPSDYPPYPPGGAFHYDRLDAPFVFSDIVPGRHTKIETDGLDIRTGNKLHFFPPFPDGGPVIKLGNEGINFEAEALVYEFIPQIENPILLLNFAVVLEDPDHPYPDQPRFIVRVTDTNDDLLEECTEYDVTSTATIPGFQRYMYNGVPVNWRDWTKMSVDLSKFVGQTVRVQFITYDCAAGAHFGYCYFTAKCMPNTLQLEVPCGATSFQLQAPEGFANYLWSNGQTTDTATFITNDVMNSQITCKVISEMGCECTLYAYVTVNHDIIDHIEEEISDVICEGEPYILHNFNLPPQELGIHWYQIAIIDPVKCEQYESNLELEVLARYTYFKELLCVGEEFVTDKWNNIPQYPTPGVWRDTIYTEQHPTLDCYLADVLELTVSAIPPPVITIQGDLSPCSGDLATYFFLDSETLTSFWWELPTNAVGVGPMYRPQITLYFTDDTPGVIVVHAVNGCGERVFSLPVTPRQSYDIQLNEKICQGLVYNNSDYGFNLGVQNEAGFFTYSKHLQSSQGCDSTITLGLNVLPVHSVRIEPIDTVICNSGDKVTLLALIDDMEYPKKDAGIMYPSLVIYNCDFTYLWEPGNDTTQFITVEPTLPFTTYTVTVISDIGCSATASQNVIVNTGAPVIIDETICYGETYSAYGIYIPNATPDDNDNYSNTIVTDDCTIDFTVNLTVLPEAKFEIIETVCSGERYLDQVNGFDFTLYGSGSYKDTIHFISNAGCDSLVIFNFTINPQKDTIIYDNICQFERYNRNGFDTVQNFAGLQTYIKVFETSEDCDSTVVLRLNVYPTPVNVVDFGIAPGYPGATTTLTNWSIYYDESMIAGWEWYLDNNPSPFATTKDASYIFTEAGHTVTLKVKSINGCWAEVTKEIPVLQCPVPTLEVDKTVETCGLETVTIEGSFEDADKISIKTLNSPGRKARLTVHNDGTFTVTYNPTIANVGKVVEIVLTATDSSISCPGKTETISITVKAKPRIKTKGVCVE